MIPPTSPCPTFPFNGRRNSAPIRCTRLRERIAHHPATRVEFGFNPSGAGQPVIHHNHIDECNGILEKLPLLDLNED